MKGTEDFKRQARLRVVRHARETQAVNSYMIANSCGAVCGGAEIFMWNADMGKLAYPKRFKTRRSGEAWISNNAAYVAEIEKMSAKELEANYHG